VLIELPIQNINRTTCTTLSHELTKRTARKGCRRTRSASTSRIGRTELLLVPREGHRRAPDGRRERLLSARACRAGT
jgi:hypothetical protein